MATRAEVKEIVEGCLYQRGKILTWQREKKYAILERYGIKTIVNFWPKMDPDLSEAGVTYIHLPAVRSEEMLDDRMEFFADWVAELCQGEPVLVLCEAGVTRSVYFCILVVARIRSVPLSDARKLVEEQLGRVRLKPAMLKRIGSQKSKK